MTNRTMVALTMLICGAALIGSAGCAGTSPPPDYYLLGPIPDGISLPQADTAAGGPVIGIGPIVFPEYLDRAQIVTRSERNRLHLSEFNRWAESLEKNFSQVLMENLMMLLKTDHVYLDPWPRATAVEFRVMARVIRLDAQTAGDATLKVHWMVLRESDGEVLLVKTSTHTAEPAASDVESVVAAVNQALSAFSRNVAEAVLNAYRKEHGL